MLKKESEYAHYKYDRNYVCINPDVAFSNSGKYVDYRITFSQNALGYCGGYSYQLKDLPSTHLLISTALPLFGEERPTKGAAYPKRQDALNDAARLLYIKLLSLQKYIKGIPKDLTPLVEFFAGIDIADLHSITDNSSINNNDMPKAKTAIAPAKKGKSIKDLVTKSDPVQAIESKEERISLKLLDPNHDNPRTSYSEDNIKELAETMRPPVGLLHAITVRPKGERYEIVFGWRRYLAAKYLNWGTIPCSIKNYTDEQMLEIQMIEYLQREDISPLDEAHAFKVLLQTENIDWLAARIHKTKQFISDRIKLNDLVTDAAEYLSKGVLPLGHAVVISKLTFADQKACLLKCVTRSYGDNAHAYCKVPLEELKTFISNDIMLEFTRASFSKEDPDLYPAAGPCTTCPKRTKNSNLLFNDITSADKCTDAACFNEKIKLNVEQAKSKAKLEYGKVLSGEKAYSNTEIKVGGVSVPIQAKPTKTSIPVVITKVGSYGDKKQVGTTVYVDSNKVNLVKHEKEEAKKDRVVKKSQPEETWEQRRLRELNELWPRFEFIVKNTNAVFTQIIKEFFRQSLGNEIEGKLLFAFAGLALSLPDLNTAELVLKVGNEYSPATFKKKAVIIDQLIEKYPLQELIMIIMMLTAVDDEGDRKTDRSRSFGYTWVELMKEINPDEKKVKK